MRRSRSCSDSRAPSRPRSPRPAESCSTGIRRQVRPAARRRLARGRAGSRRRTLEVVPIAVPDLGDRARRRRPRRHRQAGRRRRAPVARLGRADRRSAPSPPPGSASRRRARAERAGHRAPARRRHERAHGRREVRARVHRAEARSSTTARSRRSTTRSCRGIPIRSPARSTRPIGRHPGSELEVRRHRRRQARRHALRDARGVPVRVAARGAPRDRPHPPDPRAHGGAAASVRRRRDVRRRPDALGAARPRRGSGCTPKRLWLHASRHGGVGRVRVASIPADLAARARACCAATERVGQVDPRLEVPIDTRREELSGQPIPSSTCTCTASTRCSTAPRGSGDLIAGRGRAGHAGDRRHRPRQHVRRLRLLEAGDRRRHQADHRHRGVHHARHAPRRQDPRALGQRRRATTSPARARTRT